jgi:CDP-diacylglycerol--glycerol-3-phosphate 3-phosphatidyltransferase/cardiolipin synthase
MANEPTEVHGRFRARDLLLVPGMLSLARIPLAVAFPFCVGSPYIALAILALAGATDVLDGWYARRFDQVTPTGSVLDGITDKGFALTVVVTLLATGRLSPVSLALLCTRELGELPLVAWLALSHRARRAHAERASANAAGKVATVLQFASIASVLFAGAHTDAWITATAIAGAIAAASYWRRSLEWAR